MAVVDDLERTRTALQMINPAPFNAEAPPAGPHRRPHPHQPPLRPQQLRRAGTRRHPRRRRRRAEPDHPDPRKTSGRCR